MGSASTAQRQNREHPSALGRGVRTRTVGLAPVPPRCPRRGGLCGTGWLGVGSRSSLHIQGIPGVLRLGPEKGGSCQWPRGDRGRQHPAEFDLVLSPPC